jgi:hypothetical protein
MSLFAISPAGPATSSHLPVSPEAIPQLVAEVFEIAPVSLRVKLLEQLMRPLGVLALAAVSNGLFARICFASGWPEMSIRWEDAQNVQAKDVVALVERVQLASLHSFDGLATILDNSSVLAGSAAAAVLSTVLFQTARNRRENDDKSQVALPQ